VVLLGLAVRRRARRLAAALALGAFLGGGATLARRTLGADAPVEKSTPIRHENRDSPWDVSVRDGRRRVGTQSARIPANVATRTRPSVRSRALGLPWDGRLVAGVQLPAAGATFFTWDPIRERAPNRAWRRWGTGRLVSTVLLVLGEFAAAHPGAPRIGIGDLSRPRGGDFGPRYGAPGHRSHQNGLDADVYYPRRDGRERAPESPAEIDQALAQDLVDRFVAAGAVNVFVGPGTQLRGDPRIVQPLRLHDDHLHVRLP
jgi:murein endopeptidase